LMRSRKRKAPAATTESAPCSTSHCALPTDGNEALTFKSPARLFFLFLAMVVVMLLWLLLLLLRRKRSRSSDAFAPRLLFPIALTRTDAEEEREEPREEKEHDAVRCEFERCKKQRQLPCEEEFGDESFFTIVALRFFNKGVETADATGTQRAESIILTNYYFLRAFFLYACVIIRLRKEDVVRFTRARA